jgi:hypothetical protein
MKRLVVSLRVHYKDADFEEGELWLEDGPRRELGP